MRKTAKLSYIVDFIEELTKEESRLLGKHCRKNAQIAVVSDTRRKIWMQLAALLKEVRP